MSDYTASVRIKGASPKSALHLGNMVKALLKDGLSCEGLEVDVTYQPTPPEDICQRLMQTFRTVEEEFDDMGDRGWTGNLDLSGEPPTDVSPVPHENAFTFMKEGMQFKVTVETIG